MAKKRSIPGNGAVTPEQVQKRKTRKAKQPPAVHVDGKALIIVESPAKAKTINKYLGQDYVVEASVGHIKNLPKSKLGVDVENGFAPEYETIAGKGEVIDRLRDHAGKARSIYIATDPDREGEAIGWHIAKAVEDKNSNIFRVLFHEITERCITDAMQHPVKINEDLVNSQQARRVMDRLVGEGCIGVKLGLPTFRQWFHRLEEPLVRGV